MIDPQALFSRYIPQMKQVCCNTGNVFTGAVPLGLGAQKQKIYFLRDALVLALEGWVHRILHP